MANREVLAIIEPGQRATVRVVALRPGETHADACRREDERSARIAARVADLKKCNLSTREAEAQANMEAEHITGRILNQAQAEAVINVMAQISNVGGICGDLTLSEGLRVQWLNSVSVRGGLCGPREEYPDQDAFRTAYGLN